MRWRWEFSLKQIVRYVHITTVGGGIRRRIFFGNYFSDIVENYFGRCAKIGFVNEISSAWRCGEESSRARVSILDGVNLGRKDGLFDEVVLGLWWADVGCSGPRF